jgi:hypothetical protein
MRAFRTCEQRFDARRVRPVRQRKDHALEENPGLEVQRLNVIFVGAGPRARPVRRWQDHMLEENWVSRCNGTTTTTFSRRGEPCVRPVQRVKSHTLEEIWVSRDAQTSRATRCASRLACMGTTPPSPALRAASPHRKRQLQGQRLETARSPLFFVGAFRRFARCGVSRTCVPVNSAENSRPRARRFTPRFAPITARKARARFHRLAPRAVGL